jgi:transposase
MAKRRTFTREYKVETVRLVQESGKSLPQVARELGVRADLLRKWKKQLEQGTGQPLTDVFPGQGRQASQEEALRRLRREVETLRQERDFLKRAAAYFAQESR